MSDVRSLQAESRGEAWAIFLAAMLAYVAWRWSFFIVWDDTASASFNKYSNNGHFALGRFGQIVRDAFGSIQGDGYRPLSAIVRAMGNAYVYSIGVSTQLFIAINGIFCGLSVVLLYFFSGHFLRSRAARILVIFLFFASTPVLSAGLVLFSGVQFLVFAFILSILLVYLHHDRDGRAAWLLPLGILLLLGPWVREFVGIAPALILVREVLYRRGIRAVGLLAALGFLHALFPTLLVSLFASKLPVVLVFKIGNLGQYLSAPPGSGAFDLLSALHWRIFGDLFSIMPPSLMLCGLVLTGWTSVMYWRSSREDLRQQVFLLVFFAAAFLPFLKVFNEQVHLAYCLMPLSLLLARQVEFARDKLRVHRWDRIKVCAVSLLAITLADHAVNIVSVRQATREIYGNIMFLAARFANDLPKDTIIISNAHHIEDIRFYAKGHIDPWAAGGGMPDRSHWLQDVASLQRRLDSWGGRDVYFLDVRLPRTEGQRGVGREHFFVRDAVMPMEPAVQVASTRYSYPFFDPLRLLLPATVATWPGPPDLEFDFYRGPALSGQPFSREVAVDYFLYKAKGANLYQWIHPTLLAQSYKGFNIVGFRDRVYAIPQPDGAFSVERIRRQGYSSAFEGVDMETVKTAIDRAAGAPVARGQGR